MKKLLTFIVMFSLSASISAQVKIGGTPIAPDPSAVLELDGGNSLGLLLPRMRKLDMLAIVTNFRNEFFKYNTDKYFRLFFERKNSELF